MELRKLIDSFVAESLEKIDDLESGLLSLEKNPGDTALVDRLFRAVHTIKGTSGSLELFDLQEFAHSMEEVLDRMRKGDLESSRQVVDTLLGSADVLKTMIDALSRGEKPDAARSRALSDDLRRAALGPLRNEFRITFSHDPSLFNTDLDPSRIVDALKQVGEISSLDTGVADAGAGEGEGIAMEWKILLRTNEGEKGIRALFGPLAEAGTLAITAVGAATADEATRLGEILVEEGSVTAGDVDEALKSQKRLGDILVEQGKVELRKVERALKEQSRRKADSFSGQASSTIRVDLGKLDGLLNLVGEMAVVHSVFQQKIHDAGPGVASEMEGVFSQLQGLGKDIQEGVMALRMLPVGDIFNRFTRLIRELSTATDKSVELCIQGEETELDKSVIEKITDPLVHLIRNAVDHGIEPIEERIALDKTLQGRIVLKAYQMGDAVYIEVADDGRGLDREGILAKAAALGIVADPSVVTDEEVSGLIFHPGLSTAGQVTGISGRGVGMDVVKNNIEQLGGRITVRSSPGQGTAVTMKLPLTLAIIEGLIFSVAGDPFIVPVASVLESFRPARRQVRTLGKRDEMVNVRGEFIPLLRLRKLFGLNGGRLEPWEAVTVMVSHEGRRFCLLVDELLGQQQVVIKKFGRAVPKVPCISGGAIMGDGGVALVIDVSSVAEQTKCST